MNSNYYPSNNLLNRKRLIKDRKNSHEYCRDDHESGLKKADLHLMTGSENIKNSDTDKEIDHHRHNEREINRYDNERLHHKYNFEGNRNYLKRERKITNSRKDHRENLTHNHKEIKNRNKSYQIREGYNRQNKSKNRNYLENENRSEHNFQNSDDYHEYSERSQSFQEVEEEMGRSRSRISNKKEYRPIKIQKHDSYKERQRAPESVYRNSNSYNRPRAREEQHEQTQDVRSSGREEKNQSDKQKKFNFMIILPKNYFRIIEKDYDYIIYEVNIRIKTFIIFLIN